MKNINKNDFVAKKPFKLIEAETQLNTKLSKSEIKDELKEYSEKLSKIQDTMYAHNKYGVLVCFKVWIPPEKIV